MVPTSTSGEEIVRESDCKNAPRKQKKENGGWL